MQDDMEQSSDSRADQGQLQHHSRGAGTGSVSSSRTLQRGGSSLEQGLEPASSSLKDGFSSSLCHLANLRLNMTRVGGDGQEHKSSELNKTELK